METSDILLNIRALFKTHFKLEENKTENGVTYALYGEWAGSTSFNERSCCLVVPIENNAIERLYVASGPLSEVFFPTVKAVKHAMKELKVPKNHDISYFNLFFITPSLSKGDAKMIRTTRVRQSYSFLMKGSSALRIVAIDLEKREIVTNSDGKYFAHKYQSALLQERNKDHESA